MHLSLHSSCTYVCSPFATRNTITTVLDKKSNDDEGLSNNRACSSEQGQCVGRFVSRFCISRQDEEGIDMDGVVMIT